MGCAEFTGQQVSAGIDHQTVTAASILLLQERGLNVQDPVKKHIDDAPAAWDRITIYHLLTHTSGIPSFTSFQEYATWEPFATTPAEAVKRFRDKQNFIHAIYFHCGGLDLAPAATQ